MTKIALKLGKHKFKATVDASKSRVAKKESSSILKKITMTYDKNRDETPVKQSEIEQKAVTKIITKLVSIKMTPDRVRSVDRLYEKED